MNMNRLSTLLIALALPVAFAASLAAQEGKALGTVINGNTTTGHVLVFCRVRLFFLPFVRRSIGFFALLSQWCFEPCRVAKDNESLGTVWKSCSRIRMNTRPFLSSLTH